MVRRATKYKLIYNIIKKGIQMNIKELLESLLDELDKIFNTDNLNWKDIV